MNYLITGGARGIGAGIVLEAVKAGHSVAFTYLNSQLKALELVEEATHINPSVKIKTYPLEVGQSQQVHEVLDQVLDDFETIEVIVNNAAINQNNLVALMSDEEWHSVLETNLNGPFYVCRHLLPQMIANRFGRIINVSSLMAESCSPGMANYAASKAGLNSLTKVLASEYGPKNITSNLIVPGAIQTDMYNQAPKSLHDFWHTYCPSPNHRAGTPGEIGQLVNFLASEAASYINGAEIAVNGGLRWVP